MKVEISERALEEAVKRHEDSWEKELKEVDIRAVVLKTKKSLLEQALINARCQNAATEHHYKLKDLESRLSSFKHEVSNITEMIEENRRIFKQTIDILTEHKKDHEKEKNENKKFSTKIWEFFKCLTKGT